MIYNDSKAGNTMKAICCCAVNLHCSRYRAMASESDDTECSEDPYMLPEPDEPSNASLRVYLQTAHNNAVNESRRARLVELVTNKLLVDAIAEKLTPQRAMQSAAATAEPQTSGSSSSWTGSAMAAAVEPQQQATLQSWTSSGYETIQAAAETLQVPKASSQAMPSQPDGSLPPPEPAVGPTRTKERCELPGYDRSEWCAPENDGWFGTRREYERTVFGVERQPGRGANERRKAWWTKRQKTQW